MEEQKQKEEMKQQEELKNKILADVQDFKNQLQEHENKLLEKITALSIQSVEGF